MIGEQIRVLSSRKGDKKMKFDFIIGNPPYQEENDNNSRKSPIYNLFMEESYQIADVVELITPGRFLFDAGQTPKAWNKKMLNDEHVKVLHYENDASVIFPNTDIKGGVVITIRDTNKEYGKIEVFTLFNELNSILKKVNSHLNSSIRDIAFPKSNYGFTDVLYEENPEYKTRLTKGNEYMIDANIFEKIPEIFTTQNTGICVHGRQNSVRTMKYVKKEYIKNTEGLHKYLNP